MCCRFDYVREHRERGITVIFANPSKKVVRQLEDARLVQHIGALCCCCCLWSDGGSRWQLVEQRAAAPQSQAAIQQSTRHHDG